MSVPMKPVLVFIHDVASAVATKQELPKSLIFGVPLLLMRTFLAVRSRCMINSLPTIRNSLKKQKSCTKV